MTPPSITSTASKPPFAEVLCLDDIHWSGPQLDVRWSVDKLKFASALWYDAVDFDQLVDDHGESAIASVVFHIALFEMTKGVSFGPSRLEIRSPWLDYLTPELAALWYQVTQGVWAQWRYQHDMPDYRGPTFPAHPQANRQQKLRLPPTNSDTLCFSGGGKDSLLAAHMLDTLNISYDALSYSHSIYGTSADQLALIEPALDVTSVHERRRIYMYDTSTDLPLPTLSPYSEVHEVTAAETPSSLFATLPIALAHGYRHLVLAHEKSANEGNLEWEATGEQVNHQWGKSLEAESLLDDYVSRHLLPELRYFSILQPVHDALIFGSLREISSFIPLAHSCNIKKPWCMRCPKCAYVWICYKAWLPWSFVDSTFNGVNLLDLPENEIWFRQLLGLERHTPFECVGQVEESRLAFAMAKARGLQGTAMGLIDEVGPIDIASIIDRYLAIDRFAHRIPRGLAPQVLAFFESRAIDSRGFAQSVLRV